MTSAASILYPDSAAPAPAPATSPAPSAAALPAPSTAPAPAATPAPAVPVAASPSPAPVPANNPEPAASADATTLTTDGIEASIPDAIREQRAKATRRLYGNDGALAKAFDSGEFAVEGLAPEVQVALARETASMAVDLGLDATDVSVIRDALRAERASPMDDATRISNRETIVSALNDRYGDDALSMANLARRYVQMDPRRGAMLQGAGDSPAVVLRVVELALEARRAGRLR